MSKVHIHNETDQSIRLEKKKEITIALLYITSSVLSKWVPLQGKLFSKI